MFISVSAKVAAVVLIVASAGWLAEKRADRQALDLLVRRLEYIESHTTGDVQECARKAGYHADAMLRRRGGALPGEQAVVIDSTDEQRLIMALYGHADCADARGSFWREKWNAVWAFVWRRLTSWLWNALPWAALVILVWWKYVRRERAVRQWDACTERLPPDVRETFRGPDLEREHGRLKRIAPA